MGIFDIAKFGDTARQASVAVTASVIENGTVHKAVPPAVAQELYTKLKDDISGFKDSGDKKIMEKLLDSLIDGNGWTAEESARYGAHYQQAKANEPSESSLFDKLKDLASSGVLTSASEATSETSV